MLLATLSALAAVLALITLALYAGHIPWLRRLTGAAPLLPEEPVRCSGCVGCGGPDCIERGTDPDFTASVAAGYVTYPEWGPAPERRRPVDVEVTEDRT